MDDAQGTLSGVERALEKLSIALSSLGVKAEEAVEVFARTMPYIPPLGETEEELIRGNPNISRFQKWRLIRGIRKARKGRFQRRNYMTVKKIATIALGIALYFVLGITVKIPLISHIQTDLGYIAFGFFLYMFGPAACIVGVAGCLLESILISGWIPAGWMIGQLLIGLVCGIAYKKIKSLPINIIITIIATFAGIAVVKTGIECALYDIPLIVKFPKNAIAFIADTIPMIAGLLIAWKFGKKIIKD